MTQPTRESLPPRSSGLSLRQAVRPAVFAHALMAGNRAGAARLAAECDEVLQLTRELLRATGRAALLGAEPESSKDFSHNGTGTPLRAHADHDTADPGTAPGEGRLLDAYAEAAMAWAKVAGSLMALGGTLLEQGDWADVRRLADVLADAGEAGLARDLRIRLGSAVFGAYRDHLLRIGATMPPEGIARGIEVLRAVLREVPEDFPERNREVNRLLAPLAASIYKVMKAHGIDPGFDSRVEHIATGGVAGYPEIVTTSLDELAAEFESLYR